MSGHWFPPDDLQQDTGTFNGSAHSVSQEGKDYDPAEAVRRVAEEVTGKRFLNERQPIGFVYPANHPVKLR